MAIAYRASGTFVAANSTSSGAIGLPAGLANGDIMVLPVQARGGGTVTTPSGYTRAAEVNITKGHRLVVFYKYVTNAAGEAAPSVTQSASGLICGRISAFSGGNATTQLDVAAVTNKHADLATVTASSITPVSLGAMAVWIFSSADDNTLNAQSQGTNAYSSDTTTGVDGSLALGYELQTNAAATGVCTMTQSANGPDNWNTVTLALRPAAVVTANPSRDLGFDSITYAVEMAFGSSAFAPDPTWTDVSAYVRAGDGISVTRGRNSEFSDTQPGTMSFTLNNRARLFDPEYSAGTYFGQLAPQVRCRLRVRKSSVNYPIFDGYVQSFSQTYQSPREAVVQVVVVDLMSRLATRSLPATLLQLVTLGDSPAAYFPFDESPVGTSGVAVDATGNGHDGNFNQLDTFGSFLPGEPARKAKYLPDRETFSLAPFAAQGDPLTLLRSMEIWVQVVNLEDLNADGIAPVFVITGRSVNNIFEIELSADALLMTVYDVAAVTASISSVISRATVYHIATTLDSTGTTLTLYVNGAVIATADTSALTFEGGAGTGVAGIASFGEPSVQFAHLALYEETLTAAQVLEHYVAGQTGGNLQTTPERLDSIVDYLGLATAGLYDDSDLTANSYLAAAEFSGTALSSMQSIMTTEQGRLFVDSAGVLQVQGRSADMKDLTVNATSQATLADSGTYAYAHPDGVHIQPGHLDLMKNAIYVTLKGGAVIPAIDTASITQYDLLDEQITSELNDPTAARNLGLSRLRRYKNPTTRIDQVTLLPHGASDVRYPVALGVELGWCLTVQRTPQALGSAISKAVTVAGITHTVTDSNWITSLYLVPAQTVYTAQPWFVMGDATYGRLGAAAGNQLPY